MIIIGYVDLLSAFDESDLYRYRQLLPEAEIQRIARFKHANDACLCLYGKLLLKYLSLKYELAQVDLRNITLTEFRRPVLPFNYPLGFNISHSNNIVITAVAINQVLGVDIEYMKAVNLNDFDNFFPGTVYREMLRANEPVKLFYHYWTKYEAALKANGKGFLTGLEHVQLFNDHAIVEEQTWYLQEVFIAPGYVCHLATATPHPPYKVVKCHPSAFVDLLHAQPRGNIRT